MKTERNTEIYNNQLNNEENDFFSEIDFNKKGTWNRIEAEINQKKRNLLFYLPMAASVLLIFGMSIFYYFSLKNKNSEIKYLSQKIENQINTVQVILHDTICLKDTLVVYKNKIVYNQIFKLDTVTNFITKVDTIFLDNEIENNLLLTENENYKNDVENIDYVVNIANTNSNVKNKKFKFRLKFGKSDYNFSHNGFIYSVRLN